MPAVRLKDVRSEHGADVWLGATLARVRRLKIIPSMRGKLAYLSLIIVRVEVEEAFLSHDIDTGLPRVLLRLVIHTAAECVHLLRFQVHMQADKVRVASSILQVRLSHVQESVDLFDELGAHFP